MHIYAISDLHLSGEPPSKPMDVFGEHWRDYKKALRANWLRTVSAEDYILICGDISWAMQLEEAAPDLAWLAALPGRKILLRGNHDYWWGSLRQMRQRWGDAFLFLQNGCVQAGEIAVCGSRGWTLPAAEGFGSDDRKIYAREGLRLELSLEAARALQPARIIAALHYPPLTRAGEVTVFTELLERYGVSDCVYGHLHGDAAPKAFTGCSGSVRYHLVSCDAREFMPQLII